MRTLPPLPWSSFPQNGLGWRMGARRKLSKTVVAAARKTGTHTRSHTFCASFRLFSYFAIAIKIIHSQEGYHPHPTASEILKMPTNGGYLKNAPILEIRTRAQIELFEKLYEAFKAGFLDRALSKIGMINIAKGHGGRRRGRRRQTAARYTEKHRP